MKKYIKSLHLTWFMIIILICSLGTAEQVKISQHSRVQETINLNVIGRSATRIFKSFINSVLRKVINLYDDVIVFFKRLTNKIFDLWMPDSIVPLSNMQAHFFTQYHQREMYDDLEEAFGTNNKLLEEFCSVYFETKNINEAKSSLLPKQLREIGSKSNMHQLYSLFKRIRLNPRQAEVLSKYTGRSITPMPSRFNNYMVLGKFGDKIQLYNVDTEIPVDVDHILQRKVIKKGTQIIIDGDIQGEIIQKLADEGVIFVRSLQSIARDIDTPADNLRFLYVMSREKSKLMKLLNIKENQYVDFLDIIDKITINNNSKLIDGKDEMSINIAKMRLDGELPIVIFNNIDNTLFDEPISSFGIHDFVSCESYRINEGIKNYVTTDVVMVNTFVDSVEKVMAKELDNVEHFWFELSHEYDRTLKTTQVQESIILTTGITVPGVGVYWFLRLQKKEK